MIANEPTSRQPAAVQHRPDADATDRLQQVAGGSRPSRRGPLLAAAPEADSVNTSLATARVRAEDRPNLLDDSERTRCEVWTRVMGYHRPVSAFNAGKRAEHAERRYFVERGIGKTAGRMRIGGERP